MRYWIAWLRNNFHSLVKKGTDKSNCGLFGGFLVIPSSSTVFLIIIMAYIERIGMLIIIVWLVLIGTVIILVPLYLLVAEQLVLPEVNIISKTYNAYTTHTELPIIKEINSGKFVCLHLNGVKECYEE